MANKPPSTKGHRGLTQRVKTARKRSNSSARWLHRQLNDPYVAQAKREGYRSRAAFKIIEIDEKHGFLSPGKKVLDLGAAPGGWSQVAAQKVQSPHDTPTVLALDILPMDDVLGVDFIQLDFMQDDAPEIIRSKLSGGVDVVLSDMAPNTTGHAATDHLRIMAILEAAYPFACEVLNPGGAFIAKVFQGGTEKALLTEMKRSFDSVRHMKPKSSRSDSSEIYVVAMGFKPLITAQEHA